jgi:RNA polymerase sigma-54 factor
MSKNPLLESRGEDDGDPPPVELGAPASDDAPDDPGADDLIRGAAEDDRPLDVDWTAEALETDSYSDVVSSGGGEEAFDFDRLEYAPASLSEHLFDQLHGASGPVGEVARAIAEMLDETGYLTVPLPDFAAMTGSSACDVEQALELVQGLDPPGIAARSLAECLALQARAADRYDPRDGAAERQSRAAFERGGRAT